MVQKGQERKNDPRRIVRNFLIFLARLEGVEPPTYGLEVRCSIQLSYRRSEWAKCVRYLRCFSPPCQASPRPAKGTLRRYISQS